MKRLYKWLVALANVVSFTSIAITLPKQLVVLAGFICFADFVCATSKDQ